MKNQMNSMGDVVDIMLKDEKVRREIGRNSHEMFFRTYFSHYMEFPFGDFHHEMFALSQDESVETLVVVASRGVGKSTVLNMSLVIWSILGVHKKRNVIILSQTQAKARQHYRNIKRELEENQLLKHDLGPFKEESGEWGTTIVLTEYDASITFASTEQSIRGNRHKQYRPDLIIADDLEDNDSVKTREGRDKAYNWLTRDILPAGSQETRLIVLGTMLHEDSLMMRLRHEIESGKRSGTYREYPLVDVDGTILWPSRFPDQAAIDAERLRIGDETAWHQEFLLHIISTADRVVHPEWIQRYDLLPEMTQLNEFREIYIGVDLAISQKESADYTAMVPIAIFGWGKNMRIYILPQITNERLNFPAALERAKALSSSLQTTRRSELFVENNGYQEALVQMLQKENYPVTGIPSSSDKRSRLAVVTPYIQNGAVLFPASGAEELIQQLVGFGIERHDDLSDAFAMVVQQALNNNHERIRFIEQPVDPRHKPITAGLMKKIF